MRLQITTLICSTAAAAAFNSIPSSTRFVASSTAKLWQRSLVQLSNAPKQAGHDVRSSGTPMEMDPEEMKIQTALAEHQQNAPKLGFDVE